MNDITYVGKHTVIYTVSRHAHESWEFVYCTFGSGTFLFDDRSLDYREGDVVVIPPMVPHSNASADGFQNIHINMVSPALSIPSPTVISDDSNHFLLDAFNAAFFHFYSARPETSSLLSVYGDLISCYLAAYRTGSSLTPIVAQIENNIISPKIQGDALNLQPVIILCAITIGMYMFGLLGAIIAIPIAGCIRVLVDEYPRIKASRD